MSICIRTAHTSNGNGRGQVIAKGAGKQRTVSWEHNKSSDWNHGNAAGTLALVLFQGETARRLAAESARHMVEHDGRHRFVFLP